MKEIKDPRWLSDLRRDYDVDNLDEDRLAALVRHLADEADSIKSQLDRAEIDPDTDPNWIIRAGDARRARLRQGSYVEKKLSNVKKKRRGAESSQHWEDAVKDILADRPDLIDNIIAKVVELHRAAGVE